MRRGTTPTYILTADADLTGYRCIVTLKGRGGKFDLEGDRLTVETVTSGGTTSTEITFTLTQQETLRLDQSCNPERDGYCKVQLRAIDASGTAVASDIADIDVKAILKDGVIAYAED